MMIEFHVKPDFLRQSATRLSGTPITIEQLDWQTSRSRIVVLFGSADREAIDAALAADDTVVASTHVSAGETGHWYSIQTDDQTVAAVGRAVLNSDSFLQRAVWADDGWTVIAQFPNKSTVLEFRDRLLEDGVDIDIQSVTEETGTVGQFGVTNPQQEVLMLALREGYFTVPRDASLSDLAAELDISSQAASERIRRGTRTLLGNTLAAGQPQIVESPSE